MFHCVFTRFNIKSIYSPFTIWNEQYIINKSYPCMFAIDVHIGMRTNIEAMVLEI